MPCLAFHRKWVEKLFPHASPDVELLPILVRDEEWVLVNCLKSVDALDLPSSILHRDPGGTIFMVQKLTIAEPMLAGAEMFVLNNSDRSYTFLTETFVERVKN